jgi:hypothetical protein
MSRVVGRALHVSILTFKNVEIKSHLEASSAIPLPTSNIMTIPRHVLQQVRNILLDNLKFMKIAELSEAQQVC